MHDSTDVVALTAFTRADAPLLCEADGDPEHRRWFEFPPAFVPSLAHSEEVVARWEAEIKEGTRFPFAVRSVLTNELLGGCELRPIEPDSANLSYWTHPRHRRRGVAARAVRLAIDLAFNELGLRTVEVVIDPANLPSIRVARSAGFVPAGERDGKLRFVLEQKRP